MLEFLPLSFGGRRKISKGRNRRTAASRRSTRVRAGLESLEDRLCLSAFAVDDSYVVAQDNSAYMFVLSNDSSDAEIDDTTLEVVSPPSNGSVSDIGGYFWYTPAPGYLGTDSFQYRFTDTAGSLSNTATVSIDVQANTAPVANDDSLVVYKDSTDFPIYAYSNDSDAENNIDYSSFTVVDAPGHGTVTVQFGYLFLYTPDAGYVGSDSFTYMFRDLGGLESNVATVSIEVAENQPPVANDDSFTAYEGAIETVLYPYTNDSDPENSIDYSSFAVVDAPSHGSVTVVNGYEFHYTPDAGYLGSDSFTYMFYDTGGLASNVATVFIDVVTNQPPVANDDFFTVYEGSTDAVLYPYLNDVDPEDSIDYSSFAVVDAPSHGTVTVVNGYEFHYTPDPGYLGSDSFTYMFSDTGGLASNVATAFIDVVANQPPVANDDFFTVFEESTNNILYPYLNDVDPEGNIDYSSFAVVDAPSHGTVTVVNGYEFHYTPDPGYLGSDSFTYMFSDTGGLASNVATVYLDVRVNTPPVAVDDVLAVAPGMGIGLAAVLGNDYDPDGEILLGGNVTVVTPPTQGAITYNSSIGQYVYVPNPGATGSDTFTYTVADSGGKVSNVATATILFTGVNPLLTSPTAGGTLPEGVTPVGGVVLDMIGVNGVRVVSQLAASELYIGFFDSGNPVAYRGNPGTIGIQTGITSAILAALGGGLTELSVRITLWDGDTGQNDFDDQSQNFLLLNGVNLGDFSDVATVNTSGDGKILISYSPGGGFRNDTLDTGYFYTNDPTVLENFFATLTGGQVVYQLQDVDPYDNYFDFTQGIDGGLIDVGTAPNTRPSAVDDAATTPLNTAVVIDVASNDTDSDGTIVATSVTITVNPLHGSVVVDPLTGLVTYTPNANFSGSDTFRYIVRDNEGAISNQGTVTVNVLPLPSILDVTIHYGTKDYSLLSNTKTLPFVNISSISFKFAQDVILSINDIALTGVNVASYGITGYSYDSATKIATWTLSKAIGADRLTLSILGDEILKFNVLPGDYNQDGVVTIEDARAINLNPGDPFADLDGDGDVDIDDINASRKRIKSKLP